jgi:DNA-binding response OmpR family regulator
VPGILLAPPEADPVDRVRAIARGADDVLERPFVYEELLARIRALLRRVTPASGERTVAGEIVVDRLTRRVSVRGRTVQLAGKEFELVAKLATDPRRVFTKEELLRDVWASGRSGARERWIRTRRGCGGSSAWRRTITSSSTCGGLDEGCSGVVAGGGNWLG